MSEVFCGAQIGMRPGKGVIKYPDGAMYDGEWKDDLRDGYGKYIYADGTSFQVKP